MANGFHKETDEDFRNQPVQCITLYGREIETVRDQLEGEETGQRKGRVRETATTEGREEERQTRRDSTGDRRGNKKRDSGKAGDEGRDC